MKRIFDILVAGLGLTALAPVLAASALAVRLTEHRDYRYSAPPLLTGE